MTRPPFDEEAFKAELIRRAVKEPAFRAALKADPKGTVERALGEPLADHIAVEIVQETDSRIYLVLPLVLVDDEAPPGEDRELHEDELEQVSGGAEVMETDYRHDGVLNRAVKRHQS